jgi:hypothetical protein
VKSIRYQREYIKQLSLAVALMVTGSKFLSNWSQGIKRTRWKDGRVRITGDADNY